MNGGSSLPLDSRQRCVSCESTLISPESAIEGGLAVVDDLDADVSVALKVEATKRAAESALAQETANLIPICKDDFGSSIKLFGIFEPVSVADKYRMPRTGQEGTPDQDEKDDAREVSECTKSRVCVLTAECSWLGGVGCGLCFSRVG